MTGLPTRSVAKPWGRTCVGAAQAGNEHHERARRAQVDAGEQVRIGQVLVLNTLDVRLL